MSRSEGTMRFDADGEARLSWLHAANLPTVTFMARYAAGAGAAVIVPLETLELPDQPLWWFDGEGRMLKEERETLRVGERLIVISRSDVLPRSDRPRSYHQGGAAPSAPLMPGSSRSRVTAK